MKFKRLVPVAGLILFSSVVQADGTSLTLSPKVCVVEKNGEPCPLTFSMTWRLPTPRDVCLKINQTTLGCWHQSMAGEITSPLAVTGDAEIRLVDGNTAQVLAREELNVQSVRRTRKRLRSPWHIF